MKQLILTFIVIGVTTLELFAQGGPPATPIDGGLSLLLTAGGIYGVKRMMKGNKNQ